MPESDRRRFPRLQVSLPARLDFNGTEVEALARNIGLGGVSLIAHADIPLVANHPVLVGIITDAGALEINGRILEIRGSRAHSRPSSASSPCGFAIAFDPLQSVVEQVLISLLDGLCEKTLTISLTVHSIGALRTTFQQARRTECERRDMPRVRITLPVTMATLADTQGPCEPSSTINISATGVCLETSAKLQQLDDHVRLTFNLPASVRVASSADRSVQVEGKIVWVRLGQRADDRYHVGMRFLSDTVDTQRQITGLVGELLMAAEDFDALLPPTAAIVSELVEYRNEHGQNIVAYLDQPEMALPGSPAIIISPDYAECKQAHVTLAYYLAANGFRVLRYDHSNHVGESDGDPSGTTMSSFRADLEAMINLLAERMPGNAVGIIASGVAGRVALKVAALDRRPQLLMLLSGMVDLQEASVSTHHQDLLVSFLRGTKRGISNIFGLEIDADRFLEDAIKEGYADLRSTQRDAQQLQIPVVFFSAETELGASRSAVEQVINAIQRKDAQLYPIPQPVRRLHDDPRKEWAMFRQVVALCIDHLCPSASGRTIVDPAELVIGRQNRLERQRGKARRPRANIQIGASGRHYLEHFHSLANIPEYWHLLDQIGRLVGPLPAGAAILDAGCGFGNFGMFLLLEELYQRRVSPETPSRALRYIGVEGEITALHQARQNFSVLIPSRIRTDQMTQGTLLSLACADLNSSLPFRDNQFQAIICNLVLGYMEDAVSSLREFMRVLAPGGRIVVTSLKPYADLIEIYHNFLIRTNHAEDVEDAERLLDTTCKIKQAESDGLFRSFRPDELAMLLMMTGAADPRIMSAFGNQAYVVVAEKQYGEGSLHRHIRKEAIMPVGESA